MIISRDELRARISEVPRVSLGHLPTPLEFCERLTEAVDGPCLSVGRGLSPITAGSCRPQRQSWAWIVRWFW